MNWEAAFSDIYNALVTAVEGEEGSYGATVLNTEPSLTENQFPTIVLKQTSYRLDGQTLAYNDRLMRITLEAQIYAIKQGTTHKRTIANSLADMVISVLQDTYHLSLDFGEPVPNFADENVYRIILRFSGTIREDTETIYAE